MRTMVIDGRVSQSETAVSDFNDPDSVLGLGLFFYVPQPFLPATSPSPGFLESDQNQIHTPRSRSITELSASAILKQIQGEGKMLLGKRPRPPMKRTTSMSEIGLDLSATTDPNRQIAGGFSNGPDQRVVAAASTLSPAAHRTHSADFTHTPDLLRSCSLCKRPLVPSRDIYMYRGDSAFCSVECRQQAMNRDERKEKGSWASKKKIVAHHSARSKVASNGETVGAL